MGLLKVLGEWPVARQVASADATALDGTAASIRTEELRARTAHADRVVKSVCPYCAVGCGQNVYVKEGKILDIEGDDDSPISRGRLCPKGAATFQLVAGDHRLHHCLYRPPRGKEWQLIPLERATEMVAERVRDSRERTWEAKDERKKDVQRTLGIAHLGGATLDNEENYLLKKLYTALGIVQVENQARI